MAGAGDQLGGRSGGHDLDALLRERIRELEQAGLVVDRHQGTPHGDEIAVPVVGGLRGAAHVWSFRSMVPSATSRTVWMSSSRSTSLIRSCRWDSVSPGRTGIRR